MTRQTVTVALPDHAYPIHIEAGLLGRAGESIRTLTSAARIGVVTDSTVGPLLVGNLKQSLQAAGFEVIIATVPAGEASKTLPQLMPVYDAFLHAKFERTTPLLALGGGVVGDMTGFVAATLLRGVPFIQMPTTLLSMVDASVGGKTGVDHPAGKNLIGAFHQPIAVLIDPAVLQTLPQREFQSGLAECIKHEVIRDAEGFAVLEMDLEKILSLDIERIGALIAHNVSIKAAVVAADPFERGERAHLNFGHTFGHAIELVSKFEYPHGVAVGLGMCAASYAAMRLKMIDEHTRDRIQTLIARAGLPIRGLTLETDPIIAAMYSDKKVAAGKLRFVLPDRVGHVVIRDDLPRELVVESLQSLMG